MHYSQETGYAYDSALVLSQAVSHEPCSSMNGINIGQNERNKMASCLKKVRIEGKIKKYFYEWLSLWNESKLSLVNAPSNFPFGGFE